VREVSRIRNMRSPDFSVGLWDWELTMVEVWEEEEVGLESKEAISGLRYLDPNLAFFVIHRQTMTHLFRSTAILVQTEFDSLSPTVSPSYTYRESIREISMVAHWISPGRAHASLSQTRSPPMKSPINIFQSPTHFPFQLHLPSYIFSLSCIPAVHRRPLGPPATIVGRHEHVVTSRVSRAVFPVFLVDHLGP